MHFGPFTSKKTWNRVNEVVGNSDGTVEDVEAFALEAILSVNENEIVKLWREKLMVTVEKHERVPFYAHLLRAFLNLLGAT